MEIAHFYMITRVILSFLFFFFLVGVGGRGWRGRVDIIMISQICGKVFLFSYIFLFSPLNEY